MKAPAPRKSLGQHFLFDRSLLRRIVDAAGVGRGDRVLEIGPGPGGLTEALVEAGAVVLAIEADERMVAHLTEMNLPGLTVIRGDALETDFLQLAGSEGQPFTLVANLPYNISGPLLAALLRQRAAFSSMTVMLQKEVAERLVAPPGTRARGRLSVLAQNFCRLRPVMRVPPGAFRPPPKVESTVLRFDVLPSPAFPVTDEERLWSVVRVGFGQRRKTLRNALRGLGPGAGEALAAAGLAGTERAEQLTCAQWAALADALESIGVRDDPADGET